VIPERETSDDQKGKRMILGGGAGEGLAAVCGHQSGAQGMRVEMPAFSREIKTALTVTFPLPGATSAFCLVVSLSHVSFMSHV
jgi:hypothetical protein